MHCSRPTAQGNGHIPGGNVRRRFSSEQWSTVDRAAFIAAVASIGPTFAPSRLPRSTRDQAVAVGVVSAVNYGVASTGQAALRAMTRILLAAGRSRNGGVRAEYVANLGGVAVGLVVSALAGRSSRPAVAEAMGRRVAARCAVGLLAAAAGDAGRRSPEALPDWARPSSRTAAAAVGAIIAARSMVGRRNAGEAPVAATTARALLTGATVSVGLIGIGKAEQTMARGIATTVARGLPQGPVGAGVAGVIGRACVLAVTASSVRAHLHRSALNSQTESVRIEPTWTQPPAQPTVSGGPTSVTAYDTLGREGSRFVHAVTTSEEISRVVGASRATPVRVYVGLKSADTPDRRVQLAMHDLESLGAFDRSIVCLAVPAGTGYVNTVAIGALEYLTGGDCATVALQYSLRRSYYSLNRVGLSVQQNRQLLAAIANRVAALPKARRPQLILYGESLGALAAQRTLEGDGSTALDPAGIQLALFAGTPSNSSWARHWRSRQSTTDGADAVVEVGSYDEWTALEPARRGAVRAVLLSHHDDPVTVFDRWLLIRPPQADRIIGRQQAPPARFRPLTTFTLTALDLKNAMTGDHSAFTTIGHDYRGDLTRFVSAAYRLPCDERTLDRIEVALRQR